MRGSEGRTQIHSDMEKREMKMKTEGGGRREGKAHTHTQAGRRARAERGRRLAGRKVFTRENG